MSEKDSTNTTLESVKEINQVLDQVISDASALKRKINDLSGKFNDDVEVCATCDFANPFEVCDDGGSRTSNISIECELFRDDRGRPLIINKRSPGCQRHRPKKSGG